MLNHPIISVKIAHTMLWKLYSDSDAQRWNDLITGFPNASILESYEWGELKRSSGWEPIRLVVEDAGEIKAAISILKRKTPYFNKSIFYAPRGPGMADFKDETVWEELLKGVKEQAQFHHAMALKIDPFVQEKDVGATIVLKKHGFHFVRSQIQPRATFILDLSKDLDALLASFEEKTRYNIRLAERKGVEVRENPSEEGVKIFYNIYEETAKRDKFTVHPLSYYQRIRELIIEKGMGGIFIAYYQGEPIAGVYIFCFGDTVWYMYGASSAKYRNIMPNHALHWQVIQWAKERGYKKYDLWGIPAHPHEGHPLWGVYRFKKGFNGEEVRLIGMCDLPFNTFWYNLIDKGIASYRAMHSLITKGKISDSLGE
ncbi:MAG: peptidoglycan bridge formation glycyltransferase FemA/FemB family protein [Candidatus Saganbacteria bacterium]|nr:peptidoglycan bridge formation glycyltransferase FemA/FemB family protein [Candidatus Saganbacteria bacterium]